MISVIMPSYNRACFIKRALDNIANQTVKDIEVIIVDDGSTDNTREIIARLRMSYPFKLRYIFQDNEGAASARQTGVEIAEGQYLAFFDSDDIWDRDYLNILKSELVKNDLDWIYCATERRNLLNDTLIDTNSFRKKNNKNKPFFRSSIITGKIGILNKRSATIEQLKRGIFLGFQNSLYKSEVFNNLTIPCIRIGEDRLFSVMLLKSKFVGAFFDGVLVSIYEHSNNTTTSDNQNRIKLLANAKELLYGYNQYDKYVDLTRKEKKIINVKISSIYFWLIGYSNKSTLHGIANMKRGLSYDKASVKKWKTYLISLLRYRFRNS